MITPYPLEFPLLQYSQERDLRFYGEITYLIQEERSAVSCFKPPQTSLQCTREGSFFVPEKLGRNQRLRNRRTVDADEDPGCAFRSPMQSTGNELFAGSSFAQNEHGGICRRNFLHLLQDLAHGFTGTDNFFKHRRAIDFFPQNDFLVPAPLLLPLLIIDVGCRTVPADDLAVFVL